MEKLQLVSSNKSFGGYQKVYSHESSELKCKMNFSIYLPPQAEGDVKLPVIFYLSGLTCTEQNFITKSGFQRCVLHSHYVIEIVKVMVVIIQNTAKISYFCIQTSKRHPCKVLNYMDYTLCIESDKYQ